MLVISVLLCMFLKHVLVPAQPVFVLIIECTSLILSLSLVVLVSCVSNPWQLRSGICWKHAMGQDKSRARWCSMRPICRVQTHLLRVSEGSECLIAPEGAQFQRKCRLHLRTGGEEHAGLRITCG